MSDTKLPSSPRLGLAPCRTSEQMVPARELDNAKAHIRDLEDFIREGMRVGISSEMFRRAHSLLHTPWEGAP